MRRMKFSLKSTSINNGRQGVISEISGKPNMCIETPAAMMYTKGGCVPHLTYEVLELVTKDKLILQTPLVSTLQMNEGIKVQQKGLLHFTGMDEHTSFVMFQDPCIDVRLGKFETDKMPLWTRTGKSYFDANSYMDVIENFKPNFYAVLSDNCTDDSSSKKRISKSVDRSEMMLETCIQRHKESEYLNKNSSILGVIVGGNNVHERKRFINTILKHSDDLDGFILDGIDYNGSQMHEKSFESIKDIVTTVTSLLPEDKFRIAHGCWNPVTLLDLVQHGWDMFDTTLPYLTTQKGCCITFNFDISIENSENVYEIDLSEERYKEDMTPVLDKCECLCCKKYTRAYIHHLLNTRELLSSVLIMIHNVHHYMKFFESIRANVANESLAKLRDIVALQYNKLLENTKVIHKNISTEQTKARKLSTDESSLENTTEDIATKI